MASQAPIRRSIRRRTWEVLEVGADGDQLSRTIDLMIMGLVVGNVVAVVLESIEPLAVAYHDLFLAFEEVSIAAFSAEFLLRVWSAADASDRRRGRTATTAIGKRLRYLASPMAIVDLLAIAPYFVSLFAAPDLRFLRILRLLRIVKLTRYSDALSRIVEVYRMQRSALAASFFVMTVAIVLSASLIYVVEHPAQPEAFGSIPAAMWWSVAALTTVGYGDVTPITPLGKLLAASITIVGVGMVALPTSLLASGFAHIMHRNEQALEEEAAHAFADGELTIDEADAYARLAEALHVEPEIAREVLAAARHRQDWKDRDCPHCGKPLA